MVIIAFHYSHPIYVPIIAQVILDVLVRHGYSNIYDNIFFLVNIPDKLLLVVIWIYYYYHFICIPIRSHVISSAHVPHRYLKIYKNISYSIWWVLLVVLMPIASVL